MQNRTRHGNCRQQTLSPVPHSDELNQTLYLSDIQLIMPPGKLLNIRLYLILAHWPHGMKTMSSKNWKYITYRNAIRWVPSHGHRQYTKRIWQSLAMRFSSYASRHRQTDKQTDILITILYTPPGDKVMIKYLQTLYNHNAIVTNNNNNNKEK